MLFCRISKFVRDSDQSATLVKLLLPFMGRKFTRPQVYGFVDFLRETRTHSMARHRKSPRSQRNLTVIDPLTLPKAPGGGGGPKKLCRCMCHSCE